MLRIRLSLFCASALSLLLLPITGLGANDAFPLPFKTAFPSVGAKSVSPDTPLQLTFPSAPTVGASGRVRIVDTATGVEADRIDLSETVVTKTIGGEPNFRYLPVIVSGNKATLFPRNGALKYGATYAVVIDPGVFSIEGSVSAGSGDATWTFTTKPAGPSADANRIVVAADGSGDFCTVQGALDHIPEGNTRPTTVFVRRGTYVEIIFFTNKHAITIAGEDRKQTVIEYATNDKFNKTNGNPFGAARPDPAAARPGGSIYHRGVFLAHRVDDLVLTNLTIRNTTPQGGSQAEAIILNGTTSARAILKDIDLYSYQDTLQINGQAFVSGCYIEGDVDFLWGTGPCFFENTTCRSLRSGAYYTQVRNPPTNHGYVFVNCRFDGAPGVTSNYLSRIEPHRFSHSEVVLIDCTLTEAVGGVAWQFQKARDGTQGSPANIRFWEFNSRGPDGKPVDVSARLQGSRQLTEPADAATIANYRDPAFVLGNGWNPRR